MIKSNLPRRHLGICRRDETSVDDGVTCKSLVKYALPQLRSDDHKVIVSLLPGCVNRRSARHMLRVEDDASVMKEKPFTDHFCQIAQDVTSEGCCMHPLWGYRNVPIETVIEFLLEFDISSQASTKVIPDHFFSSWMVSP